MSMVTSTCRTDFPRPLLARRPNSFRDLLSDGQLVDPLTGHGIETTWPAARWTFFRLPFDHLVHSEQLTTVDRYLGPSLRLRTPPHRGHPRAAA